MNYQLFSCKCLRAGVWLNYFLGFTKLLPFEHGFEHSYLPMFTLAETKPWSQAGSPGPGDRDHRLTVTKYGSTVQRAVEDYGLGVVRRNGLQRFRLLPVLFRLPLLNIFKSIMTKWYASTVDLLFSCNFVWWITFYTRRITLKSTFWLFFMNFIIFLFQIPLR